MEMEMVVTVAVAILVRGADFSLRCFGGVRGWKGGYFRRRQENPSALEICFCRIGFGVIGVYFSIFCMLFGRERVGIQEEISDISISFTPEKPGVVCYEALTST